MTVNKDHIIERSGKQFILYTGLLAEAHSQGLVGIKTTLVQIPSADNGNVAIVHATAEMKDGKTFDGIGDANANNVGPNIKGHIIRMAETRAKARAMRDATNIGITAFEELGSEDESHTPETTRRPQNRNVNTETGEIPFGPDPKPQSAKTQAVAAHVPNLDAFREEVRAAVVTVAQAENQEATDIFHKAIKETGITTSGGMPKFNLDDLTKLRDWCNKRLEILV